MNSLIASFGALLLLAAPAQSTESSRPDPHPPRMVEVNGTQLTYVESGSGEPVVFVHGTLGDSRVWTPQLEAVSAQYHAIGYSRRYHFPNAWVGDATDYSRAVHAADLAAFIRALNLGPVHLAGHSYGGALAVRVAIEHPELVRSLVLGEPGLFVLLNGLEGKSLIAEQARQFGEVLALLEEGKSEEGVREYIKTVVGKDVFDRLPGEARSVVMDNVRTLLPTLRTFYAAPLFACEEVGAITAPALIISGGESPTLYRTVAKEVDDCLPHSRLVVLQGASHGLQMEKPAEFNQLVMDFLSSQRQ